VTSPSELAAVRHLVELGYEDPLDVAMRRAVEERGRQTELARAQDHLDAGQLDDAIAICHRLALAAPEWMPPHRLLAQAHYRAGRHAATLEELEWLEVHAVEHPQLAMLRAAVDMARRRFDAALDHAQYAIHLGEVSPHLAAPGAGVLIGEVHLRRGQLDQAQQAFQSAVGRWPTDAGALAGLAGVDLRRGNYNDAVDHALQAVESNVHLPLAHYRLGVALVRLENYPNAQVAFEAYARLSPRRAAPYRWLTFVVDKQGDASKAAQYRSHGRQLICNRRAMKAGHR
jgi:tetratricopeptide (TPR) repeat protein